MTRRPTVRHAGGAHHPTTARRDALSAPPSVAQWTQLVATQWPPLSRPQATVLALWSLGLVLARACGLTAVRVFLAHLQERKENTVRQQLREWCYEAPAKRGTQRQALAVEACFAPLLRWVLHWWQWQRTRMTHPARAARLWLAVAVATLWLVRVGGVAEDTVASSTVLDVTAGPVAPRAVARPVGPSSRGSKPCLLKNLPLSGTIGGPVPVSTRPSDR